MKMRNIGEIKKIINHHR